MSRLDQLGVAARLTLPRRQGAGLASAIAAPPPPTGPSQVSGVVWPQTLATERLLMRPLQVSDRREFLRAVRESRDAAARFMPLLLPNESEHDAFSRQLAQREAGDLTGRDWRRIAVDRTGRIVGGFNVNDIRRGLENRGEITLWVHPGVAGRGLATEGLAALVEMALAPLVPRAAGEQSRAARGGLGLNSTAASMRASVNAAPPPSGNDCPLTACVVTAPNEWPDMPTCSKSSRPASTCPAAPFHFVN